MRTGEFSPGVPGDYIRTYTDVEWKGINEPCPLWDRVTLEIMNKDVGLRDYLLTAYASALIGKPLNQIMLILTGSGSNGKSMFVNVIDKVFGNLTSTATKDLLVNVGKASSSGNASPIVANLHGKRLVTVSETEDDDWLNVAQVKSITGDGKITARRLFANPVTWQPTHTPVLVTNFLPRLRNSDDLALRRRIKVIPFKMTFMVEGSTMYKTSYNPADELHAL